MLTCGEVTGYMYAHVMSVQADALENELHDDSMTSHPSMFLHRDNKPSVMRMPHNHLPHKPHCARTTPPPYLLFEARGASHLSRMQPASMPQMPPACESPTFLPQLLWRTKAHKRRRTRAVRRLACDPVPSKALQRQQGKAKAQQDKDGGLEDFELWPRGEAKRRAAHEEHAQLWKQRYKRAVEEFDEEAYEREIDEIFKDATVIPSRNLAKPRRRTKAHKGRRTRAVRRRARGR